MAAAVAGDTPKIVYVKGIIDANTDSSAKPLSCQDYAVNGYTLAGYLKAYDPAAASQPKQAARLQIKVGSNTTHRHPQTSEWPRPKIKGPNLSLNVRKGPFPAFNATRSWANGFVGLDNFRQMLLHDPLFWQSLGFSVRWVVVEVGLQLLSAWCWR